MKAMTDMPRRARSQYRSIPGGLRKMDWQGVEFKGDGVTCERIAFWLGVLIGIAVVGWVVWALVTS